MVTNRDGIIIGISGLKPNETISRYCPSCSLKNYCTWGILAKEPLVPNDPIGLYIRLAFATIRNHFASNTRLTSSLTGVTNGLTLGKQILKYAECLKGKQISWANITPAISSQISFTTHIVDAKKIDDLWRSENSSYSNN